MGHMRYLVKEYFATDYTEELENAIDRITSMDDPPIPEAACTYEARKIIMELFDRDSDSDEITFLQAIVEMAGFSSQDASVDEDEEDDDKIDQAGKVAAFLTFINGEAPEAFYDWLHDVFGGDVTIELEMVDSTEGKVSCYELSLEKGGVHLEEIECD